MAESHDSVAFRFPAEIVDIIIDFLQWNLRALRACSLTCRTWLPRSRCHLFGETSLNRSRDIERFHRLMQTAPHIGLYVMTLHISLRSSLDCEYFHDSIAKNLGSVTHLDLYLPETEVSLDPFAFSSIGCLQHLRVRCPDIMLHANFMIKVLSVFPTIRDLDLRDDRRLHGSGLLHDLIMGDVIRRMSRLDNKLRLLCLSGTRVLTLLAGAPNGFRTQELHLTMHEPSDWAAIPTLLQKTAGSLTKLTIDMTSVSENETPDARDLNAFKEALKSARSLRALSIYTQPWHLPHLYELVSCIAPSSLEQLDLQSDLNGTPELSYLESLARILNDVAQFPSLRELELYYEGYPHEIGKEKTKQIIDEMFAPLHARGIAQLDFCHSEATDASFDFF